MRRPKQRPEIEKVTEIIRNDSNITFFTDVWVALGCAASTFYKWYPVDSDDYNEIADALEENKTALKRKIREKLIENKNPYALITLYRLLGTPEERAALATRHQEENKTESKTEIELKLQ